MVALLMIFPTNFPLADSAGTPAPPARRGVPPARPKYAGVHIKSVPLLSCLSKIPRNCCWKIFDDPTFLLDTIEGWRRYFAQFMQANHDMDKNYWTIWSAELDFLLESIDSWIPISEAKVPFVVSHVTWYVWRRTRVFSDFSAEAGSVSKTLHWLDFCGQMCPMATQTLRRGSSGLIQMHSGSSSKEIHILH